MKKQKQNDYRKNELDKSIRLIVEDENRQLFAEQEQQRFQFSAEKSRLVKLIIILVVIVIVSIYALENLFTFDLSIAYLAKDVMLRIGDTVDLISGAKAQSMIGYWIMEFFAPLITGLVLAVAGASFQGIFHNPMASPTLLGVQSGGSLGAAVYLKFFYTPMIAPILGVTTYDIYSMEYSTMTAWQKYSEYLFTLAGCVAVVVVIMLISKAAGRGKMNTVTLMVGGTIFSGCISSVLNLVIYYESTAGGDTTVSQEMQLLQSGAFSTIVDPFCMLAFALTALIPLLFALICRNRMNVISFGEEEARVLGVDIGKSRLLFIMLSTLMTASVITFCGNIAFIGLIVPHFARQIVGNDYKQLIPASAILGGIFMVLAYDFSYMINGYLNVGGVISTVGSAIFFVSMVRYRRQGNADWA